MDRSLRALARKELAGWWQFGRDGGGKAKQLLAMFEVLDLRFPVLFTFCRAASCRFFDSVW